MQAIYQVQGLTTRAVCSICGHKGPKAADKAEAQSAAYKVGFRTMNYRFTNRGRLESAEVCKACVTRLGGNK